jgi:hypothetical protein
MTTKWNSQLLTMLMLSALSFSGRTGIAAAQVSTLVEGPHSDATRIASPCESNSAPEATRQALRLVCLREPLELSHPHVHNAIIIGFLGGFVRPDDLKHPEVLFATYLRDHYGPAARIELFGNHEAKKALHDLVQQLDTNHDGRLSAAEKKQAEIILYGHSWGASQVVTFATDLERLGIPVALTVQIDSVKKLRQNDRTIPANVASAVNFYQEHGLTPGQPHIAAADVNRTTILGNFRMTYEDHRIKCDNYHWLSQHLNRGHHEIENDPHVWDHIESLIESQLTARNLGDQVTSQIGSSLVKSTR